MRSPTRRPRTTAVANSGLKPLDEAERPHATAAEQEKVRFAASDEAPPLQSTAESSPMDIDYAAGRRLSTGGSAAAEQITALPHGRAVAASPHLRPATQDTPYNWNTSQHTLQPTQTSQSRRGKLQKNPTPNKRSAQYDSPLARRMSSKKRRKDPVREEEVKAMSKPIDLSKKNADIGLLRRESKKTRGPMNRNLGRPTSTISLPFEDSIHSSMSGEAEPRKYRLSTLDVMSPRPAIRYKDISKTHTNDTVSSNLIRKASRSDRPSGKPVSAWRSTKQELEARERARIDSLADDMGSTELRDILERDRKRKEKKQERDHDKLQRKLERRAEKQRTKEWLARQEAEKVANETAQRPAETAPIVPVAAQVDHDTHMTDDADFPMDDINAREQDPFRDPRRTDSIPAEQILEIHPALRTPKQQEKAKAVLGEPIVAVVPRMPFLGPHDDDDVHQDLATPVSEIRTPLETPALDTAQAVSYTAARPRTPLSPITSSIYHGDRAKASKILGADVAGGSFTVSNTAPVDSASKEDSLAPLAIPARETGRKDPETLHSASRKKSGFLASLFRGRRTSIDSPRNLAPSESSFSNTSREEMSRSIPAHLVAPPSNATSFKKAAPPLRSQSIFREDLPESPASPPESRVQSPVESSLMSSRWARRQNRMPSTILSEDASSRVGSPDDLRPISPLSNRASYSHIMAHSLASVDSEASWLSGGRHRSHSGAAKHASGSFGRREEFNGSYEELGMPDDEYFQRLNAPRGTEPRASGLAAAIAGSHNASSTLLHSPMLAPQPEETSETVDGQLISYVGATRQPTVIHRADTRHKSSEGLLNTFQSQGSITLLGKQLHVDTDGASPEDEYPTPTDTPTGERSSVEIEEEVVAPVQRATSVNYGKGHARNMSAGSAKLLDIPRRGSRDISGFNTPNLPSTPAKSTFALATADEKKESP